MCRWLGIAAIWILIVGVPITSAAQEEVDPEESSEEAPPETASKPAHPLPQVIIATDRQALRQRVSHFVRTVTTQVGSYESIARWGVKVCPSAVGLPARQNEFIAQRISAIAQTARIRGGDHPGGTLQAGRRPRHRRAPSQSVRFRRPFHPRPPPARVEADRIPASSPRRATATERSRDRKSRAPSPDGPTTMRGR